ncbi:MAG: hypothetical protein M5U01_33235 [Ardenticatenaceae bacterium]|nr:hypothetical protein [Ardenticatenaceae bacterium]
MRAEMGAAAVAAARAVGYENAGTVEFILDAGGRFYFLEMNTRLQVEHPVTELVMDVDLVRLQIEIAAGRPLVLDPAQLTPRGHALECRIYAEDPANGFVPSTGRVLLSEPPAGPGIRVDAGVASGDEISRFYDPLVAKVIVWAEDRDAAIARMEQALAGYALLGVTTNIPFLRDLITHPVFRDGAATTHFVEAAFHDWSPPGGPPPDEALIAAALAEIPGSTGQTPAPPHDPASDPYSPWRRLAGFRVGGGS